MEEQKNSVLKSNNNYCTILHLFLSHLQQQMLRMLEQLQFFSSMLFMAGLLSVWLKKKRMLICFVETFLGPFVLS